MATWGEGGGGGGGRTECIGETNSRPRPRPRVYHMANMAEELYGLSPEIRKLRKKLRQIENLEVLERDLTEDEHAKV